MGAAYFVSKAFLLRRTTMKVKLLIIAAVLAAVVAKKYVPPMIDINSDDAEELQKIKYIGTKRAAQTIAARLKLGRDLGSASTRTSTRKIARTHSGCRPRNGSTPILPHVLRT